MVKSKEIFEGWKNLVFKKEHVERIAKARLNICNTCEWHSKHHNKPHRPDEHCVHCGCTIAAKVRSMKSECPIAKWPAIQDENGKTKKEFRD